MDKLRQRHPDLADAQATSVEPAIKRMMQAVAFRHARTECQPDGMAGALLGALGEHYLRPMPSCSVVQVEGASSGVTATIPRGTELAGKAHPVCRFRTVFDVAIAPVAITSARFVPCVDVPPALGVPPESACAITITIESTDPAAALDDIIASPLRLFVDAGEAMRAAFLDALFTRTLCTCVQAGLQWCQLAALPFAPAGTARDELLLPAASGGDAGLRLLAEYFACPEKFAFFDIDLKPALARCPAGTRQLVLHVLLPALATPGALQSLSAAMLRPGCTPVVNLFARAAEPVPITAKHNTYPLRAFPTAEAPAGLYSVDTVTLLQAANRTAIALPRFEALRPTRGDHYWLARHADTAAGAADTISFVDAEQRPLELSGAIAAVQLTCTNGTLPASLPIGRPGGDLAGDGAASRFPMRFLRQPTVPRLPAEVHGSPWKQVAALAPGEHGLTPAGLPALLGVLRLHAPADSAAAQQQLAGIVSLDHRITKAWLRFPQGASYLQGVEVRLTIDEAAFERCSVFVFAQVMEQVFAFYAQEGSFTQLVVLDAVGQERVRCGARAGSGLPV